MWMHAQSPGPPCHDPFPMPAAGRGAGGISCAEVPMLHGGHGGEAAGGGGGGPAGGVGTPCLLSLQPLGSRPSPWHNVKAPRHGKTFSACCAVAITRHAASPMPAGPVSPSSRLNSPLPGRTGSAGGCWMGGDIQASPPQSLGAPSKARSRKGGKGREAEAHCKPACIAC